MMTQMMNDPRVWERRCGRGPPGACPRWRDIESSIVGDRGEGSDDADDDSSCVSSDEEMGGFESVPLTEEEGRRLQSSTEIAPPNDRNQCRSRNHGLLAALFGFIVIIAVVSTVFATAYPRQSLEVVDDIATPEASEDQIMIGTRVAMEQAKFMILFNEEMDGMDRTTSGGP